MRQKKKYKKAQKAQQKAMQEKCLGGVDDQSTDVAFVPPEPNDDTVLQSDMRNRTTTTVASLKTEFKVGLLEPKNRRMRLVLEIHVADHPDEVISRLELKIRGRDVADVREFHSDCLRYGNQS